MSVVARGIGNSLADTLEHRSATIRMTDKAIEIILLTFIFETSVFSLYE